MSEGESERRGASLRDADESVDGRRDGEGADDFDNVVGELS